MSRFRQAVQALRGPSVRIGLEVELDADGQLTLREEDRDWPDLLVGAVHWIARDAKELSEAELRREFMKATEGLLSAGVDVLAHPLRLFGWAGRDVPKDLYAPLAEALAATGTAAEINLHKNRNDPAFFAHCIGRGVKIALGSDAHEPSEAGALGPHLSILRQAAEGRDLADILYDPFKGG
jgi:histidinol phosphatase-like PHP family hydrolase